MYDAASTCDQMVAHRGLNLVVSNIMKTQNRRQFSIAENSCSLNFLIPRFGQNKRFPSYYWIGVAGVSQPYNIYL